MFRYKARVGLRFLGVPSGQAELICDALAHAQKGRRSDPPGTNVWARGDEVGRRGRQTSPDLMTPKRAGGIVARVHPSTQPIARLFACLLACWLAGLLACWLAGLLVYGQTCSDYRSIFDTTTRSQNSVVLEEMSHGKWCATELPSS
jgi:hypothetical protein